MNRLKLAAPVVLLFFPILAAAEEPPQKFDAKSLQAHFKTLTDGELCRLHRQLLEEGLLYRDERRKSSEYYLTEMIRRGGPEVEKYLQDVVQSWNQNRQQAEQLLHEYEDREVDEETYDEVYDRRERFSDNLELVTALRRIQGRPDPLKIFIKEGRELEWTFPGLPRLTVSLRNVDEEKVEVGFTESGDYRTGRQARWRFEVTDADGSSPRSLGPRGMWAGGMFQRATLKHGEAWFTELDMTRFVESLPPGEFRVRILYHNQFTIADDDEMAGLIVSRSDPIRLTIKRRTIEVTAEQRQEISDRLKEFDFGQRVKSINGSYGPWAYRLIDPASHYGKILSMGWGAVPRLIEELVKDDQTPVRRAHLLALLYAITGENNPGIDHPLSSAYALGPHTAMVFGWSIRSWRNDQEAEDGSASFASINGPNHHDFELRPKAQAPLIEKWRTFLTFLDVKEAD